MLRSAPLLASLMTIVGSQEAFAAPPHGEELSHKAHLAHLYELVEECAAYENVESHEEVAARLKRKYCKPSQDEQTCEQNIKERCEEASLQWATAVMASGAHEGSNSDAHRFDSFFKPPPRSPPKANKPPPVAPVTAHIAPERYIQPIPKNKPHWETESRRWMTSHDWTLASTLPKTFRTFPDKNTSLLWDQDIEAFCAKQVVKFGERNHPACEKLEADKINEAARQRHQEEAAGRVRKDREDRFQRNELRRREWERDHPALREHQVERRREVIP